jgi:phosphatidylinositol alpha-1,6-mannosyltransferase
MPKVLLMTPELLSRGGIQHMGLLVLRCLRERYGDDHVRLVTVNDDDDALRDAGLGRFGFGAAGRRSLAALRSLDQWLRWRPDMVVFLHINLTRVLPVLEPLRHVPALSFVHGIEAWEPVVGLKRRGVQRLDHVLFDSQHTQRTGLAANPWLASLSAEVCHCALLPAEPRSAVTAAPSRDAPYVLTVGRMAAAERYKGHDELIEAWPAIGERRPELELVVVGDGNDRPRLERKAERLGANVRFLGAVDDATRDALLRHCCAFALPSRGEGFGLVYLEAMREGRPVLTSNCDAGQEVIVDGETGRVVDPGDRAAIADAVIELASERAEAMGRAGQVRYQQRFSYQPFFDRFAVALDRLKPDRS